MAKKYFIWKDRNCNGVNPEWIELSGREFYQFIKKAENSTRRFELLDNQICEDADELSFEVTEERYIMYCKERRHKRYLAECAQGHKNISLQEPLSDDEELTVEDVVADESADVEEQASSPLSQRELLKSLSVLSGTELETANLLLLSHKLNVSEREICRQKGIPHTTFISRKEKMFEKIKKSFDQS